MECFLNQEDFELEQHIYENFDIIDSVGRIRVKSVSKAIEIYSERIKIACRVTCKVCLPIKQVLSDFLLHWN